VSRLLLVGAVAAGLLASSPAGAQSSGGGASMISSDGVIRATQIVDAVFVTRKAHAGAVGGADWVAYMMARLGIRPIPDLPGVVVAVDTGGIIMSSKLGDLPPQTRTELGPLVGFLDPSTPIAADITLTSAGPQAVRFHLQSFSVAGFGVPEMFLASYLADVGKRYPALTATGRDLLVQVPAGGRVTLAADSIRLALP
jgi:hypothetical protein